MSNLYHMKIIGLGSSLQGYDCKPKKRGTEICQEMMNSISNYNPYGILSSLSKASKIKRSVSSQPPFPPLLFPAPSYPHLNYHHLCLLRTRHHASGRNIPLVSTHPGRPGNNLLLLLHQTTARAAPREETVRGDVTLEVVLCADFTAADEVEDPAKTAVLGAAPH